MTRIDIFNEMVGLIFAQLYEEFPVPTTIDPKRLGEAMGRSAQESETLGPGFWDVEPFENGDDFYMILFGAAQWLRAEGFTRTDGNDGIRDVVLSSKALAVLDATPTNVDGMTLGRKLSNAAAGAGTEAGRSAIGEIVGTVIGAVARNLPF